MMKYFVFMLLIIGALSCMSQSFSKDELAELDSLNTIITNVASHDTSLAYAYVQLSNLLYLSNNDTVIPLCIKANEIVEKALLLTPSLIEETTLKATLGRSFNNMGFIYNRKGEIKKALEYHNKNTEIQREIGDMREVARSLGAIGKILDAQGETRKALEHYRKSLRIRKEIGDKEGIAHSLHNIGFIYKSQGDLERALEYFTESIEIKEEIGDLVGLTATLNNVGQIYSTRGDVKNAVVCFERGLSISEEWDDKKGICISLSNIGSMYQNRGDIPQALEYFHRSLKILEETSNNYGAAGVLNSIGRIYYSQNNITEALSCYERSREIYKRTGNKSGIGNSLNKTALVYLNEKKYSQAKEYYQKSLKIYEEIGHKAGIAQVLSSIGVTYMREGDLNLAEEYYYRSWKHYKEMGSMEGISHSLIIMGHIHMKKGELDEAEKLGLESFNIVKKFGYPAYIRNVSRLLYEVYNAKNEYKKSLEMYELYIQMRDSLNNESTQKAAIKQNMQYEYEKQSLADSLETAKQLALKDIEIDKQQAEAKAERTTKYGLFGGMALVLVIAFVLGRSVNQKKKANAQILAQKQGVENSKRHIEQLHKEVTDSIHYAAHIQNAILTSNAYWQRMLANYFILFKPRDIVSGDFYWAYENLSKKKIWIAADCTGHGVPGGFMSMLGNTFLNEIIIEQGIHDAAEILNKLRDHIIKALASDVGTDEGLEMKDGMDLALCILHTDNTLEYSGANNPLWVLSENRNITEEARTMANDNNTLYLHELKADKQPIGKYMGMKPFTSQRVQLQVGDQVYIFTDGFPDQFGGPKLKKYMSKMLKKFLLSIADSPMEEQKALLLNEFEEWKVDTEQVDDVCIIGVKI